MTRARLRVLPLLAVLALPQVVISSVPAAQHGETLYLAVDAPTDLGGETFLPWQILRAHQGAYSSVLSFPPGTAVDSAYRMDKGHWLVSVESPTILAGIPLSPSDVLELYDDAGFFARRFDGVASGIPAGVNVRSVFLDGGDAGDLVMSFDVPVTLSGQTFEPADLVRFDGSAFRTYFDASAVVPPIPTSVGLAGAARWKSLTLLTFNVPATLGDLTVKPGEVVSWDGNRFALFHQDPSWPAGSGAEAIAMLPRPGRVPPTLEVRPSAARGMITLSWSPSCSSGAEDYAIYEGTIGSWYSHTAVDCSDDGSDLKEDIPLSAGNRYYLVVAHNPNEEGSYGTDSRQVELPQGAASCTPSQIVSACP